jgi:hypothetical protein
MHVFIGNFKKSMKSYFEHRLKRERGTYGGKEEREGMKDDKGKFTDGKIKKFRKKPEGMEEK